MENKKITDSLKMKEITTMYHKNYTQTKNEDKTHKMMLDDTVHPKYQTTNISSKVHFQNKKEEK